MLRKTLALLVALMMLTSSVSAKTPEQEQFEAAQAAFEVLSGYMQDGMKLYEEDNLTGPVVTATLSKGIQTLDDIIISECFAKWYALEYSAFVILAFVVTKIVAGVPSSAESTTIIQTGAYLDSLAEAELPSVDCDAAPSESDSP